MSITWSPGERISVFNSYFVVPVGEGWGDRMIYEIAIVGTMYVSRFHTTTSTFYVYVRAVLVILY